MSLSFARFYVWLWGLLSVIGWTLSALHQLNRTGYAVCLLAALAASFPFWRRPHWRGAAWRRRFGRWLPGAFLFLLALVLLGGCLYPPNNYDALTYRIPRVLHWLAEERWFWINALLERLNIRPVATEWTMAPIILFFHSERLVWLYNAACFAGLPGLIYSAFVHLGVSRRAAYRWMWLLPTGYTFLLQAGGDANDLAGAYFALAALALALRARARGSTGDLLASMLAIAVAGGSKASNLPLALPWLLAAAPSWRLLLPKPAYTALAVVTALGSSIVPIAYQNIRHVGEWSGESLEVRWSGASPGFLAATNVLRLLVQNGTPPVFPMARSWNERSQSLLPAGFAARAATSVEGGKVLLATGELPIEDTSGTGPLFLLLIAAAGAARLFRHDGSLPPATNHPPLYPPLLLSAIRWSPWVAFVVALVKMSLATAGRLLAPYYLLLAIPLLVGRSAGRVTSYRGWRLLAGLQLASAILVLVITPTRPLFPALTLLENLPGELSESSLVIRAHRVYATFRNRYDGLRAVRSMIPPEQHRVGLVVDVKPTASLWRPYGSRVFENVLPTETSAAALRARGLEYLVVSSTTFPDYPQGALKWARALPSEVISSANLATLASEEPTDWFLCRLLPPSADSTASPASPLAVGPLLSSP